MKPLKLDRKVRPHKLYNMFSFVRDTTDIEDDEPCYIEVTHFGDAGFELRGWLDVAYLSLLFWPSAIERSWHKVSSEMFVTTSDYSDINLLLFLAKNK